MGDTVWSVTLSILVYEFRNISAWINTLYYLFEYLMSSIASHEIQNKLLLSYSLMVCFYFLYILIGYFNLEYYVNGLAYPQYICSMVLFIFVHHHLACFYVILYMRCLHHFYCSLYIMCNFLPSQFKQKKKNALQLLFISSFDIIFCLQNVFRCSPHSHGCTVSRFSEKFRSHFLISKVSKHMNKEHGWIWRWISFFKIEM